MKELTVYSIGHGTHGTFTPSPGPNHARDAEATARENAASGFVAVILSPGDDRLHVKVFAPDNSSVSVLFPQDWEPKGGA